MSIEIPLNTASKPGRFYYYPSTNDAIIVYTTITTGKINIFANLIEITSTLDPEDYEYPTNETF